MTIAEPESMDEVVYFTRRTLEPKGFIKAWAKKKECPKCKKGLMGKPVEGGKKKIRATEYACPSCGYEEDKTEHEKQLEVCANYTCPKCNKEGSGSIPYKRKTFQGKPAFVFTCEHCGEKIPVTKRMADPKKK